jgi:hypothetical protein
MNKSLSMLLLSLSLFAAGCSERVDDASDTSEVATVTSAVTVDAPAPDDIRKAGSEQEPDIRKAGSEQEPRL